MGTRSLLIGRKTPFRLTYVVSQNVLPGLLGTSGFPNKSVMPVYTNNNFFKDIYSNLNACSVHGSVRINCRINKYIILYIVVN